MRRELPVLRGERVVLRPLTEADAEPLAAMIARPEIVPWWGSRSSDVEFQRQGLLDDAASGAAFAIETDGMLIGWLGVDEEEDPDYRHASLDIFLDPAHHGSRLGPEAMRLAITWLINDRGHHRLTIDPALDNERAIGVYKALGFKPVGVLRSYERGPNGEWHDGLLMDLLADEWL
jgi:aminoglycoside 6'-N-acetyltransferase